MIGFFDSGIGGLTIIEAVHTLLPKYDTIYLGDTKNSPYGNKPHEELVHFTVSAASWLFLNGCELIIVSCNSASASALREVQQQWLPKHYPDKRILGIIRPTVEYLADQGFKNIAVLSTLATKNSGAYVHEFQKINPSLNVISHACPNWAPMIEEGLANTEEMRIDVTAEIASLKKENPDFDAVLLACTHYPYVKNDVEASLSHKVPVFNQGEIVAKSLEEYLKRHHDLEARLPKNGKYEYYTTGDPKSSSKIASGRFGYEVEFKECKVR